MKTVLFKIQQFPHLTETFILSQIITAIEAGMEVRILVKDLLDFNKSTHNKILSKFNIRENIIIEDYKIPKKKLFRLILALILLFKNIRRINQIISYYRYKGKFSLTWIYEYFFYKNFSNVNVIHIQYGTNAHPVDLLKKVGLLKGKIIVSFHGHDAFFPINGFIPQQGYYDHLFEEDNLIVANTPYLANKIQKLGCPAKNLITIPVGVDTQYFKPQKEVIKANNTLKFVSVGRLDKIKGHHIAINLIHHLCKLGMSVDLLIIGDGIEKKNLSEQISKFHLGHTVQLVGKKSQSEIRSLLRESDVYILTAIPIQDGRRETQGLATIEAEACGLPVLAFDSGGVKYTIKDGVTGFLCTENDMDCLIEKSLQLMDKKTRNKMGQEARLFVEENFSQKKLNLLWHDIYNG